MTRDSWVWWAGIVGAIIVGLATLTDLSAYGIPDSWAPYLRLAALIIGIISGKLATSPLPGKNDGSKVDVTKLGSLLMVVALALGGLVGCAAKAPRHQTVVSLSATVTALRALQDGEAALFKAGTVPQLTAERHATFKAKMGEVWVAADAAVSVVEAWRPGQPIPPQLPTLIAKVSDLLRSMAEVLNVVLPVAVTRVWTAILDVTKLVGGVL